MRIGLSCYTHDNQSVWLSGTLQHTVFLAQALARLPFVSGVTLLDTGTQRALPAEAARLAPELAVLAPADAGDSVDVIIEMDTAALDVQWLDLMRARGKKVVWHCRTQPHAALVEPAVFDVPASNRRVDRYDEIWVLPKDRAFAPMLRTLHRCPVHEVPFIWQSSFIAGRAADIGAHGVHYNYTARAAQRAEAKGAWRVAILEPNRAVTKASSIPMLICDEAERAAPGTIAFMYGVNAYHMREHETLKHLANSLDLTRSHRASFEGRHDVAAFMAQHADAVVSHQWTCEQNYLYMDVLYGGYPLIHNSPWLASFNAGYYYPDFDALAGSRTLLDARARHDAELPIYRMRSQAVFDAVHPNAPANLAVFTERLQALAAAPARSAA